MLIWLVIGLKIGHVCWVTRGLEILLRRSLLNLSKGLTHWRLGHCRSFPDLLHSSFGSSCDSLRFCARPQGELLICRADLRYKHFHLLWQKSAKAINRRASCAQVQWHYLVGDGHVFGENFLNHSMTNFSQLFFHVTPDRWDFVANGVFVLCGGIIWNSRDPRLLFSPSC